MKNLKLKITAGILVVAAVIVAMFVLQRDVLPPDEPEHPPDASEEPEEDDAEVTPHEVDVPGPVTEDDGLSEPSEIIRSEDEAIPDIEDPVEAFREAILAGRYGDMDIDELLVKAITRGDPSRREMRLALLLRKDEALPAIKALLQASEDQRVISNLIDLVQTELRWPETLPAIKPIMEDDDLPEGIRVRAATAAALFQSEEALPVIRNFLFEGEETQTRMTASMALGRLGDENDIELLEPLLEEESAHQRVAAAMALGQLGSKDGEDVAFELSRHERFDLRCRAAEALSYIGTADAMARLDEMQQEDPSATVRSESAEYFGKARLNSLPKEDAIAELENLLLQEHPPRWAFVYLAEHLAYEADYILEKLAREPGEISYAAKMALLEIDSEVVMIPHAGGQTDD